MASKSNKPASPKRPKRPKRPNTGGDVDYGSNGQRGSGFVGNSSDDGRGDLKYRRARTPEERAARKERRRQERIARRMVEQGGGYGYDGYDGYDGFGGGYLDAVEQDGYRTGVMGMVDLVSEAAQDAMDAFEIYEDPYLRDAEGNKTQWGEAEQTTYDQVFDENGELRDDILIAESSVLYVGYGPEDMKWLDLEAERSALGASEDINLTSFINPTDELLRALVATGKFTTAVIGSHGTEGTLYTTGEDGKARERTGDEFAAMFKDSSIESVFVNACQGALGGANSISESFSELGMNVMSWMGDVKDSNAIAVAGAFVTFTNLMSRGATTAELESAFKRFETVGQDLAFDLRALMEEHGTDSNAILTALQSEFGAGRGGNGGVGDSVYDDYYGRGDIR